MMKPSAARYRTTNWPSDNAALRKCFSALGTAEIVRVN